MGFVSIDVASSRRPIGTGDFCVYAVYDERDRGIRYAGISRGNLRRRLERHLVNPTNTKMRRWLSEASGYARIAPLERVDGQRWQEAEREWIAWLRANGELLNVDRGGVCRDTAGNLMPLRKKKRRDPWANVRNKTAERLAQVSRRQMTKR